MKRESNLRTYALLAAVAGGILSSAKDAGAANANWNVNSSGNWSTPGNWTAGGPPNGSGQIAGFLNNITGTRTITLDISPTIGVLNVADSNNSHAFIIAGSNALVFDVASGNAEINKLPSDNTRTDTISAPVTLMDKLVITNNATSSNGRFIMSGVIGELGGSQSIEKLGAGRVELTGQNTFSGGVTITEGSLTVNASSSTPIFGAVTSGPLGTGTLTLNGGNFVPSSSGVNTLANTVQLNAVASNNIAVSGTSTLTGNMSGPGGFNKSGSGTLILAGTNTYAGPTTVTNGVLAFAQRASLYNGAIESVTDANLGVEADMTVVLAVGGAGEFTMADFVQLSTVGSFAGGFKSGSFIGVDTTNGGDQVLSAVFADNNSGQNKLGLVKSGTNKLTLTAANTHTGPTTVVGGGTLNLSNQLALQFSTLSHVGSNIEFDQSVAGDAFTVGSLSGAGNIAVANTGGNAIALSVGNNNNTNTYSGVLSGPTGSSVVKIGTGIQTLSGANNGDIQIVASEGTLVLSGANTHTGGTTVNGGGTLAINNASAIGTGTLTLNTGATIDNTTSPVATVVLSTNNAQVWNGNFTFTGTRAIDLGDGPVTLNENIEINIPAASSNSLSLSVGGVISGTGSLTRTGTGRMFLKGQNTFSGGVTLTGGAVVHSNENSSDLVNGMSPLGTGTLTIAGGQFIASSVNATVSTIENNIVLEAGENRITSNGILTHTGTITGPGALTTSGNGQVIVTGANTYAGETFVTSGVLSVNGTHTGGAGYVVNAATMLTGTGSTTSSVTVATGGLLNAAIGVGAFTIGGADIDGTYIVEFNGDTSSIDLLTSTGALDISGATVDFDNLGVAALSGGAHIFASYGSLVGATFASVVDKPEGYSINYNYLGGNQIALVADSVTLPGDFDGDGDVDGADFVVWQTNFPTSSGATSGQGDADGDTDVDGADFAAWQDSFPAGAGPGASPVPEPQAIGLALAGIVGLCAMKRRMR